MQELEGRKGFAPNILCACITLSNHNKMAMKNHSILMKKMDELGSRMTLGSIVRLYAASTSVLLLVSVFGHI